MNESFDVVAEHHFNRLGFHILNDSRTKLRVVDNVTLFILLIDAVGLALRGSFIQLLHPKIRNIDDLSAGLRREA